MITDEKIAEVLELLAQNFSHNFIAQRTGVSRPTIGYIAAGKVTLGRRRPARPARDIPLRNYEQIKREAQAELIRNGRDKG